MKERFRENLHLSRKNITKLAMVNEIIEEYKQQGYRLTLRQLYYQLVSRDIVPNMQSEYAKLSRLLVKGRMAGMVDWNAIEDRLRVPFLPYWVNDVADAINDTIKHYRLDRQEEQKVYIEIMVEKDALSGVLRGVASDFHINLVVNRGYSSCTAMYDAYKRFERETLDGGDIIGGKDLVILYLGDHDPSGLDMIRDIRNRLEEFCIEPEIIHVAITQEQIEMYNPPPNPAKITDPRFKHYIQSHGTTSWEVDALEPRVLNQLIREKIESLIDMELFQEKLEQEQRDKEKLAELAKKQV